MNLLIKSLAATAIITLSGAIHAADPMAMTFDEIVKQEAKNLKNCKKDHGSVGKIAWAKVEKGFLIIKSVDEEASESYYSIKGPATAEQLKSLVGKKTCDTNG